MISLAITFRHVIGPFTRYHAWPDTKSSHAPLQMNCELHHPVSNGEGDHWAKTAVSYRSREHR